MAATDTFFWQQQADAVLPEGQVEVQFNGGANPPEYTIKVIWNEPGEPRNFEIMIPVLGI